MKIIDTHCHPQFPQYDSDRDEIMRRALDSGIGMICVGTDLETSKRAIELSTKYEGVYASVGLHPNDNLDEEYDEDEYRVLVQHPKVVAIGEIGLDYYRTIEPDKREFQKLRFLRQLELTHVADKPLIIHCRSAHSEMEKILKIKFGTIRGVIHSFNGSVTEARAYLDVGFYLGLNAIVSFSKDYEAMVKSLPGERILLETDSPYLAPAPHRGKRNEPGYITAVGNFIAEVRGDKSEELFRVTTANAGTLFGINE